MRLLSVLSAAATAGTALLLAPVVGGSEAAVGAPPAPRGAPVTAAGADTSEPGPTIGGPSLYFYPFAGAATVEGSAAPYSRVHIVLDRIAIERPRVPRPFVAKVVRADAKGLYSWTARPGDDYTVTAVSNNVASRRIYWLVAPVAQRLDRDFNYDGLTVQGNRSPQRTLVGFGRPGSRIGLVLRRVGGPSDFEPVEYLHVSRSGVWRRDLDLRSYDFMYYVRRDGGPRSNVYLATTGRSGLGAG